ncbi:Dol-P-Man:Man(7)GlcNAc(2)-PP-Dol alpha-1,6-mannosyltransferase [Daldinia childiae]|uniref:Dol-P-Man:Man(7)GlcNAc(2)-PP-Dol alpha-1,6-mannosyltransferase n=1 Tax=Daldinia childiae TaxID=326645 RepID=UPI0014483C89|nr:Dol-P-Man:Man(7)GlcNAc(2)-PP-Dol alpha-1,6-mannosyltransferase [Daldinia childiae]KAF3055782.1 Dol-P-Man:Man(7)GlcNAc(2)-PP-Dol alpha-1,6-mannosyltransferase [Daldinia childiae]
MAALDLLLSLAIPALIIIHLLVAPHTKVEESFNIQATHDILVYGTPTKDIYQRLSSQYDHFDFPGAVPRTFIGPVLLAGIGQPIIALVGFQYAQLVVRGILGLFNAGALWVFKSKVEKAYGRSTARWYALLQLSQFHILFYSSRTLPNMFAFGLTTLAFSQLIGDPSQNIQAWRYKLAIAYLTIATAVFRSELAILMVTVTLYGLALSHISLVKIIPAFIVFFAMSLLLTIPIDSYFWQKPLWPELWGFYYNAVLGSSSEWGVSPWHYYFTSALPKILTNPLSSTVLIPYALWNAGTRKQAQSLVIPSLLFVAMYSLQPHKEARFIFYVAPPLTAAAALGANYIFTRHNKSIVFLLTSIAIVGSVLVSFGLSTAMLIISSLNYPGGEALSELRGLVTSSSSSDLQTIMVHTDVLSCMTGVTLFGQHPYPPNDRHPANGLTFNYDKTEDESTLRSPAFWEKFDYVLAEDPASAIGPWEIVGVVEGFAGVELIKPSAHSGSDIENGQDRVFGRGVFVRRVKNFVRALTGGWWIGPRMEPKIHILRKMREGEARRAVTE